MRGHSNWILALGFVAIFLGFDAHAQSNSAQIEWRIQNRFRFFGEASDELMSDIYRREDIARRGGRHDRWVRDEWQAFSAVSCRAMLYGLPVDQDYCAKRDADRREYGGAEIRRIHELGRRQNRMFAWDREKAEYVNGYLRPAFYDLEVSLKQASTSSQCIWSVSEKDRDTPINSVTAPCVKAALRVPAIWNKDNRLATIYVSVRDAGGVGSSGQEIQIEDALVVGLGDSFASGEGNPDIPTNWRPLEDHWREMVSKRGPTGTSWFGTRTAAQAVGGAVWLDETCHRSLMSWPAITAMAMAAENEHRAVTFLSFACGGASTFDGFLLPHLHPPGGFEFEFNLPEGPYTRRLAPIGSRGTHGDVPWRSQVDALAWHLCGQKPDNVSQQPIEVFSRVEQFGDWREGVSEAWGSSDRFVNPRRQTGSVCSRPIRRVDRLLVALGGNDLSFAEAIVWTFAPRTSPNPLARFWAHTINSQNQRRVCIEYGQSGCETGPDYRVENATVRYSGDPREYRDYACKEGVRTAPPHRPSANYLVRCFLPVALGQARHSLEAQLQVQESEQDTKLHAWDRHVTWIAYPSEFWRYPGPQTAFPTGIALNSAAPADADLANRDPRLCGDANLVQRDDSLGLTSLQGATDSLFLFRSNMIRNWAFGDTPERFFTATRSEDASIVRNLFDPMNDEIRRAIGPANVLDAHVGPPARPTQRQPIPFPGASDHFPDGEPSAEEVRDVRQMLPEWRGWCADYRLPGDRMGRMSSALMFPSPSENRVDGWDFDAPPWAWRAYAQRSRLFRTPNDSILTQYAGPAISDERTGLRSMQQRILDGFGGMMHPSAEMHAILAGEAIDSARRRAGRDIPERH